MWKNLLSKIKNSVIGLKIASLSVGAKVALTMILVVATVVSCAAIRGLSRDTVVPVIQQSQEPQEEQQKDGLQSEEHTVDEEQANVETIDGEDTEENDSQSQKKKYPNQSASKGVDSTKETKDTLKESNETKGFLSEIIDFVTGNTSDKEENSGKTRYKVTFVTGDGPAMAEQKVNKGTLIQSLPTPNKDNHIFLGWYYDEELTHAVGSEDQINSNITLYASWLEQTPLDELEQTHFASAENVEVDFTVKIVTSEPMTAQAVKDAIIAENLNNPEQKGIIEVSGAETVFTVSGVNYSGLDGIPKAGFEEGITYSLKLDDDRLRFEGYPDTAREYNFTTAKEEVLNLKLRSDLAYIPVKNIQNIIINGENARSLNVGLFQLGQDGSMSVVDMTSGTFDYKKGELQEGEVVVIYEGLNPTERTLDTPLEQLGDVAYIEITGKNGDTYSYTNAEAKDVLFEPDMLPMPNNADLDNHDSTITVEDKYLDYSADIYAQMELDSQTKVEAGDYLVFYTGDLAIETGENAAERTGIFGLITKVKQNDDGTTTITYREVSWEEVESSMDVYTQDELTAEEMLAGINTEDIVAQIEKQAYDSGFAEEAAQYLASLALATENFTKLSDNMNLEDYKVVLEDGTPVTPEQLQLMGSGLKVGVSGTKVKADIGTKPKYLGNIQGTDASKQGIALSLKVETVINISQMDGGSLEIKVAGEFVEELGYDFGTSVSGEWSWAGIIPYVTECFVSANVDALNYTGLEINAVMTSGGNGFSGDVTSVADEIKELLKQVTNENQSSDYQEKLIQRYSEMVRTESEWIKLVGINICTIEKRLPPALPIVHLEMNIDFVIQVDASIAVGFEFRYLEGKRYTFSIGVLDGKVSSKTVVLQEKTYELNFYAMGRIGIKAGIELAFKIGLIDTSIANIGFDASAGPFTKLWGYFYYELKYTESQGRSKQYAGALLITVGAYFDLNLNAEAIGGKYSASVNVVNEEWNLWSVGRKENIYNFTMPQVEMPKISMRQYVHKAEISEDIFAMNSIHLVTGEGKSEVRDDKEEFEITMTNSKFSYNPDTNTVLVSPAQGDMVLKGEMVITWKKNAMLFSSKPIQRTISLYWDNYRDGYMIVPYTNGGSYVPIITGPVESVIKVPAEPTRFGYDFDGWYKDSALTESYVFPEKMPYTDTNIYAKWKPRTDISYTVEHYKENCVSGEYELAETEVFKGTTDTYVTPAVKNYEGYNVPETKELKILADGSAVLNYYYKVQRHEVTFKYGIVEKDDIVYKLKYGTEYTPPQVAAKGYTFLGWSVDGTNVVAPETVMGTQDLVYTALWKENPGIEYRIEYYVQQKDGRYTLQYMTKDKTYTGTVLEEADLRAAIVDGSHTADEAYINGEGIVFGNMTVKGIACDSTKVTGDGKTVVKINYKRALNNVTFDYGYEGVKPLVNAMYYEQAVDAPEEPLRTGYTFVGWTENGKDVTEPITVMGTKPVIYKALWMANNYTVRYHSGKEAAIGEMKETAFIYDVTQPLAANAYTYTNYDFAGWTTQEGGSVVYTDQENVKKLTAEKDGIVDLYAVWTPTVYTIVYNGVENAIHTNPTEYTVESAEIVLAAPVRTGYTFDGWFADASYSNNVTRIEPGSYGEKQFYAKWTARNDIPYKVEHYKEQLDENFVLADIDELIGTADTFVTPEVKEYTGFTAPATQEILVNPDGTAVVRYEYMRNSYTITLDANEGSFEEDTEIVIREKYEAPLTLPVPTREGYGFGGWYNEDGQFASAVMPAQNLELTADWIEGEYGYTVNHYLQNVDGDGYTIGEVENRTGLMDQEVTPEIGNYEGFTSPEETKTITIGTDVSDNVVDYYYTRNQYPLSWNLDGGSAEGQNYTEGDVYYGAVVTAPVPVKTGHSYTWDKVPVTTMPAEELIYTANWIVNTYRVSFQSNGGTVTEGSIDTRDVVYGNPYGELAELEKAGYTFVGWFTEEEGGTPVTAETVLSLDVDHTLYAQFSLNSYSIEYIDEIGGVHGNPAKYSVETGGLTLLDAQKDGYTFLGWYENGEKVTVIPAGSIGDRQLQAEWREHGYTVVFHANNGTNAKNSQEFTYKEEKALEEKPEGYEKEYHWFAGWALSANGEKIYDNGQVVKELTAADGGTVNLYAVWKENSYSVNYTFVNSLAEGEADRYLDGVTNPASNYREFTLSDNYFSLADPSKSGYTFDGWYADADLTQEMETEVTFHDYRDWIIYGKFTPNRYKVTYQLHAGIAVTEQWMIYDKSANIPTISSLLPEGKAGYIFLGWATSEGGEVLYKDGANVINVTYGEEITLHAVWKLDTHKITYNLGMHTDSTDQDYPKEYSNQMEEDLVLPVPVPREGFVFGGWYTNAEFEGSAISYIEVLDENDYNLYAKWEHPGIFSIAYTDRTSTSGGYNAAYTVTRTVPEGAFAAEGTQTVYIRTVNGTAYGTTPEVASQSGQDKYHFAHVNQAKEGSGYLVFGPEDWEKTVKILEKDAYNSDMMSSSYRIGDVLRHYYVQIYKVESTAGGAHGVIDADYGKVKRELPKSSYELTEELYKEGKTNYYFVRNNVSGFTGDTLGWKSGYYSSVKGEPEKIGDILAKMKGSATKDYMKAAGGNLYYSVSFSIYRYDYNSSMKARMHLNLYRNESYSHVESKTYEGKHGSEQQSGWYKYDLNNTVTVEFENASSVLMEVAYTKSCLKYEDNAGPELYYVSPIALTSYVAGEEVQLTLIFKELINAIGSTTPTLTLSSSGLGKYFEDAQYVDCGTGTNVLVFTAKVKEDLTADDAMKINELLAFPENGGGTFANKIGTFKAVVKDFKGNIRTYK